MRFRLITTSVAIFLLAASAIGASAQDGKETHLVIDRADPIAGLAAQASTGRTALEFEPDHGFLRALLQYLSIDTHTQILVFSKTSLQDKWIGPSAPRAIYFNDRVAVGAVQNSSVLEIMAPASMGYVFYTLENKSAGSPRFTKHEGADCGRCHGADNLEPGLIVASTPVTRDGTPVFIPSQRPPRLFEFTDHTTPVGERWGGWYVTGSHAGQPHLGNGAFTYDDAGRPQIQNADAFSVTDLSGYFDTSRYLEPTSDIVALMVFEHQAKMTNMLLAAGVMARRTNHIAAAAVEDIVAYMLFADEAPLIGPVSGGEAFQSAFAGSGQRDLKRRSLRDFDLRTRLFKYPLSYMIYSPVFESLPPFAKQAIYARLLDILEGRDMPPRFARLSSEDRRNIMEILRATKPDFGAAN
ncbi:MAG: hypothetical protein LCH56_10135 [Proteobacteria bacterium]|nr:hypothetical protein [Pseudomonadota bacterium]